MTTIDPAEGQSRRRRRPGGAYNANVEFECTCNNDRYGVPGHVLVDVRVAVEHDKGADGAGGRHEDATGEQAAHDDLLLPRQLEPHHVRDGEQHDEEVRAGVDAARGQDVGGLVDAPLGCHGQSPVRRYRAVDKDCQFQFPLR